LIVVVTGWRVIRSFIKRMATSRVQELKLDIEELHKLQDLAIRQRVKDHLILETRKLETELVMQREKEAGLPISVTTVKHTPKVSSYDVKITNYAWDESDKFVKIYITLKNVHTIPAENVKSTFTTRSLEFSANELDGRNHTLTLPNLTADIIPDSSYNKVKPDSVTIFMKKDGTKKWSHLTAVEQKAKEPRAPKLDESGEAGDGLMSMMKQMYEDGDDDMKRTIAKAWTESREKSPKGEFDL